MSCRKRSQRPETFANQYIFACSVENVHKGLKRSQTHFSHLTKALHATDLALPIESVLVIGSQQCVEHDHNHKLISSLPYCGGDQLLQKINDIMLGTYCSTCSNG